MTFWKTYFEWFFLVYSFSHNSDIFHAIQSLYFKILREKRQNCEFISSNYYLITLVTIASYKVQLRGKKSELWDIKKTQLLFIFNFVRGNNLPSSILALFTFKWMIIFLFRWSIVLSLVLMLYLCKIPTLRSFSMRLRMTSVQMRTPARPMPALQWTVIGPLECIALM